MTDKLTPETLDALATRLYDDERTTTLEDTDFKAHADAWAADKRRLDEAKELLSIYILLAAEQEGPGEEDDD